MESVEHIFFGCVLAKFMWSGIRCMLAVQWQLASFMEMVETIDGFSGKTRRVLWILFDVQSWALWTTRNKFSIEPKFPRQPADVIFKSLLCLQQWRPLIKPKLLPLMDELVKMLQDTYAASFSPPA